MGLRVKGIISGDPSRIPQNNEFVVNWIVQHAHLLHLRIHSRLSHSVASIKSLHRFISSWYVRMMRFCYWYFAFIERWIYRVYRTFIKLNAFKRVLSFDRLLKILWIQNMYKITQFMQLLLKLVSFSNPYIFVFKNQILIYLPKILCLFFISRLNWYAH